MRAKPAFPALDLSRPGLYLRRCRERLGLSLQQVYSRTRIRSLDSIEKELFVLLPPEPYVRGFVLQYARLLGIGDADRLAQSYVTRYRQADATR